VYEVFSDAEGDLESRRNTYYSNHSKTKEEKLNMHAVDEFQEYTFNIHGGSNP
jgi:hypothetical protein